MKIKTTTAGFIADAIHRIIDVFDDDLFTFVVNGQEHSLPVVGSLLLSPNVALQMKNDNTNQR
jgi:hypothetical protein